MKLRVFTAFSGYDSQCLALERLKSKHPSFDYELVGWSEVDKFAAQAHNAIFPQWSERNFGDIRNIDWSQVPDFDLFTYSSPCQDFSLAGKLAGGERGSGTRSSLLWECERAIEVKRPKYLLMENVANLVNKSLRPLFQRWMDVLSGYGYSNFPKVMDAKHYGVPQHRERIFLVSILGVADYYFPRPIPLQKRLLDMLEDNVDEKYYLPDETVRKFFETIQFSGKETWSIINAEPDGTCRTLKAQYACTSAANLASGDNRCVLGWTRDHKGNVTKRAPVSVANCVTAGKRDNTQNYILENRKVIVLGHLKPDRGYKNLFANPYTVISPEGISLSIMALYPNHAFKIIEKKLVNGTADGMARTVTATVSKWKNNHIINPKGGFIQMGVAEGYRLRRLTPRENFRLMDVDDKYIDMIQSAGISNTQQYKLAGNSIVVACLYSIFDKMFIHTQPEETLF